MYIQVKYYKIAVQDPPTKKFKTCTRTSFSALADLTEWSGDTSATAAAAAAAAAVATPVDCGLWWEAELLLLPELGGGTMPELEKKKKKNSNSQNSVVSPFQTVPTYPCPAGNSSSLPYAAVSGRREEDLPPPPLLPADLSADACRRCCCCCC